MDAGETCFRAAYATEKKTRPAPKAEKGWGGGIDILTNLSTLVPAYTGATRRGWVSEPAGGCIVAAAMRESLVDEPVFPGG